MKAITNTLIFLSTNVMCSSFYVRRGQHEDHLASDTHLTLDTVMGGRSLEEQPVTHLSSNTFMKKEIEENMGNVWEPFDEKSDTAYFWQIPRAGSTNALAYFSICMNMTEASRMGISSQSDVSINLDSGILNFSFLRILTICVAMVNLCLSSDWKLCNILVTTL